MILGLFCFVGFSNNKYNPDAGLEKTVQKESLGHANTFVEKVTFCFLPEKFELKVKKNKAKPERISVNKNIPSYLKENNRASKFDYLYLPNLNHFTNNIDKKVFDFDWPKKYTSHSKSLKNRKNILTLNSLPDPVDIEVYFDWPNQNKETLKLLQS